MSKTGKKIIFFDIETSGLGKSPFGEYLSPGGLVGERDADQILSAYFIVTDDQGTILERMNVILGSRGDVVPKMDAIAINGLNPQKRRGLSEAAAAAKIRALLVRHGGINAVIAGHNSDSFDIPRLRSLLVRNGIDKAVIPKNSIDTMTESKRDWIKTNAPVDGQKLDSHYTNDSMSLASSCLRHDIPFSKAEAHDGRYDVEATVK